MPSAPTSESPAHQGSAFTGFAARRPITAFLLGGLGIGLPVFAIPFIVGLPVEPFLLLVMYGALLGSALLVTRASGGPGAIRRLLSRLLIWRFGLARWAIIAFAMPVLTLALGAATGNLRAPEDGWLMLAGTYLFATFIYGALLINLCEETVWGGFLQSRLMERHGLVVGSLLTTPPFVAVHVPLLFAPGWTWREVGVGFAVTALASPFYRLLIGMHLLDTGGSLLAAGIQHASWNASQKLGAGDWPAIAAVMLLTVALALFRRWRGADSSRVPVDREDGGAPAGPDPAAARGQRTASPGEARTAARS